MIDDRVRRQLKTQLDGFRESGVEWMPRIEGTPELVDALKSVSERPSVPVKVQQVDPLQSRRTELQLLSEKVSLCERCPELFTTRTQTVFGVGRFDPPICFLGEAPGAEEDRQGEPFVGAAGQLLTKIIAACGFSRDEVFICNILRCRPPGNRVPKKEEANCCREYLEKTIELIQPRSIVCLGAVAAQNLLNVSTPIGKLRGQFYQYRDIPVVCTYHPASLLEGRSPQNKKLVWDDMQMLLKKLDIPIPQSRK